MDLSVWPNHFRVTEQKIKNERARIDFGASVIYIWFDPEQR